MHRQAIGTNRQAAVLQDQSSNAGHSAGLSRSYSTGVIEPPVSVPSQAFPSSMAQSSYFASEVSATASAAAAFPTAETGAYHPLLGATVIGVPSNLHSLSFDPPSSISAPDPSFGHRRPSTTLLHPSSLESVPPHPGVSPAAPAVAPAAQPIEYDAFTEMIWPGWPRGLPDPALLDHLVTTFFSVVPSIPRIINQRHLLRRLALPPQHEDYPQPALLHMICAVAGRFTAAVQVDPIDECMRKHNAEYSRTPQPWDPSVEQEIEAISCFSERQARWGIRAMRREGLLRGRAWFEIVQAQVCLRPLSKASTDDCPRK